MWYFTQLFLILTITAGLCVSAQQQRQITSRSIDPTTGQGFCQKYNCVCPEAAAEIKCKFPINMTSVDFVVPSVTSLDFSGNSLEMFVFGDITLNVNRLDLSRNKIKVIHANMFSKMPHLHYLDMSQNQIGIVQSVAFENLNSLEFLNLSRAFDSDSTHFLVSNEIAALINLKVLDLSYADLEAFTMERAKAAHIVELHLRYTKNTDTSSSNWMPFVGSKLKLLDLTGSSVKYLDSAGTLAASLTYLSVEDCNNLDKSALVDFLKTDNLIYRLESLNVARIGANNKNLPLDSMLRGSNSTVSLQSLDISSNAYSGDLVSFLFSQSVLKNLTTFKARENKFTSCSGPNRTNTTTTSTYLTKLEHVEISKNLLNGSSCLSALLPYTSLRNLDLSFNQLTVSEAEFKPTGLGMFFANKLNLSSINLSNNQLTFLVLYFHPNHVNIDRFDLAFNSLRKFQILSLSKIQNDGVYVINANHKSNSSSSNSGSNKKPISIDYTDDDEYDLTDEEYYNEEEEYQTVIASHTRQDLDDDKRFVLIRQLNLSHNRFESVNVQHMLQSVQNVVSLDFSFNPIMQVTGVSNDDPEIIHNNSSGSREPSPDPTSPIKEEVLCIDKLILHNCHIRRMPNLQHTCINQLDLSSNALNDSIHLFLSKYTVYFLDLLNLQNNNISYIKVITSEQKYKQDLYAAKNSPLDYFYGRANQTMPNHTVIDVRYNKMFRCDCNLIRLLNDYQSIKLLNERCGPLINNTQALQHLDSPCRALSSNSSTGGNETNTRGISNMNRRLKALFFITCLILFLLCITIFYYSCYDCLKSAQSSLQKTFYRVFNLKGQIGAKLAGSTGAQASNVNNIGVQYSKLVNEATASQIELTAD